MVACRSFLIIVLCLACLPALAGQRPQLCLTCHPVHHGDRGVCTGCHQGSPDSNRKNIAHQNLIPGRYLRYTLGDPTELLEGRRLMDLYACRRCHVSGGTGNRLATDLDGSPERKTPRELVDSILHPALAMPYFGLTEGRAATITGAILANARSKKGAARDTPLVVHFDQAKTSAKDIFTRKCGPCHQALNARLGILGRGKIGPNLSGLLSPWYPPSFGKGEPWTSERLARWLKNPRTIKPWSTMRPVELNEGESRELEQILWTKSGNLPEGIPPSH